MDRPWLTIIGLGEDGPDGLSPASRSAIERAEVVAGSARHLALLPDLGPKAWVWPVPFADGVDQVLAMRGCRVVVLASGDPFWFGAGTVLTAPLQAGEWVAHPGVSVFALAAARLGWGIEGVACLGLHAAPLARIRPHLANGARLLVTLRDGAAVRELAETVTRLGFGASTLWVMEALGGGRERVRQIGAAGFDLDRVAAPVLVAVAATGQGMSCGSGLPDDLFAHDGQITKRPVRALTLSALAPCPGEVLWDIGAGSGSVSIEWLLAHPSMRAIAVEADPVRADRARANAAALGVDRLLLVQGAAPAALAGLPLPDAVFIGGGVSEAMLAALWALLPPGVRLVANGVTLEAEALFAKWQAEVGGSLLRIDLSDAGALGHKRGWRAALPVVQWSVVR